MIDLTNITPDEAKKIEMVLVMLEDKVLTQAKVYDELAHDETLPDDTRNTCRQNSQWWKEAHSLIYK